MEELLPHLKSILKETIDIELDASNFVILMTVKKDIEGIIAEPEEIITMLNMYGGLSEEISMEIDIDNETQIITLKFQEEEDFQKIAKILETIWDNAVELLVQATNGDFSRLKNIPNIDD